MKGLIILLTFYNQNKSNYRHNKSEELKFVDFFNFETGVYGKDILCQRNSKKW